MKSLVQVSAWYQQVALQLEFQLEEAMDFRYQLHLERLVEIASQATLSKAAPCQIHAAQEAISIASETCLRGHRFVKLMASFMLAVQRLNGKPVGHL